MIRFGKLKFRASLWPSLAAVAALALLVALGNWQMNRAVEKRQIQARFEAMSRQPAIAAPSVRIELRDLLFRKVEASGEFVPEHMIYLDNKIHRGRVGYHVVMPLKIGNGPMHVLVNRGWAPAGPDRGVLPVVATPKGPVRIEGIAMAPPRNILELSSQTVQGKVWENLVLDRYARRVPFPIQPIVIEQSDAAPDPLVREWEPPDAGAGKHQARALTWYALAFAVAVIYVVVNVRTA